MKTINLFTILAFAMSPLATNADTLLPPQTISAIETLNNGKDLQFKFNAGEKKEGCTSTTVIVKDSLMSDRILSVALSAYHADHPVRFRVDGCVLGAMKAKSVSIAKS